MIPAAAEVKTTHKPGSRDDDGRGDPREGTLPFSLLPVLLREVNYERGADRCVSLLHFPCLPPPPLPSLPVLLGGDSDVRRDVLRANALSNCKQGIPALNKAGTTDLSCLSGKRGSNPCNCSPRPSNARDRDTLVGVAGCAPPECARPTWRTMSVGRTLNVLPRRALLGILQCEERVVGFSYRRLLSPSGVRTSGSRDTIN